HPAYHRRHAVDFRGALDPERGAVEVELEIARSEIMAAGEAGNRYVLQHGLRAIIHARHLEIVDQRKPERQLRVRGPGDLVGIDADSARVAKRRRVDDLQRVVQRPTYTQ